MKLSEAIERGIAITAPLKGAYTGFRDGQKVACTLGCALFLPGVLRDWGIPTGIQLVKTYPILDLQIVRISVPLPVEVPDLDDSYSLMCLIEALNDKTDLTRSEINEWVKQVEEEMKK